MDRWSVMIQFVFPGQSVKRPVESIITVDPSVDRRRSLIVFSFSFSPSTETWFLPSILVLHKTHQHSQHSLHLSQPPLSLYESKRQRERRIIKTALMRTQSTLNMEDRWNEKSGESGCGSRDKEEASQMGKRTNEERQVNSGEERKHLQEAAAAAAVEKVFLKLRLRFTPNKLRVAGDCNTIDAIGQTREKEAIVFCAFFRSSLCSLSLSFCLPHFHCK